MTLAKILRHVLIHIILIYITMMNSVLSPSPSCASALVSVFWETMVTEYLLLWKCVSPLTLQSQFTTFEHKLWIQITFYLWNHTMIKLSQNPDREVDIWFFMIVYACLKQSGFPSSLIKTFEVQWFLCQGGGQDGHILLFLCLLTWTVSRCVQM